MDGGINLSDELDDLLLGVIRDEWTEGHSVTASQVKKWALALAKMKRQRSFVSSDNWLKRIVRRHRLSLKDAASVVPLSPEELAHRATCFMQYLLSLNDGEPNLQETILVDETIIYVEDPRVVTLDGNGARTDVSLKTSKFDSKRIAVVLAVSATGRKLPPLVLFNQPSGASLSIWNCKGCFIGRGPSYLVYADVMRVWIDLIAFPKDTESKGKTVVWDSRRNHTVAIFRNIR